MFFWIYHFYNEAIKEYKILFENKINKLRSLDEMKITNSYTFNVIEIDRNDLFRDSINSIMTKSPNELKKKRITIVFKGEEGVD